MSTLDLVDSDLRAFFEAFPKFELNDESVKTIRELDAAAISLEKLPRGIERQEISIPSCDGASEVRALLYRNSSSRKPTAGYLHMHGGGLVLGTPEQADSRNVLICQQLGITILSVDYRLAPEHPYPAALNDCYAALAYMHSNANSLCIDPQRIAIGGDSAGGGLAASVALLAADLDEYAICHQHLVYPMLDSRTGGSKPVKDSTLGEFCWTPQSNQWAWAAYLGETLAEDAHVPALVKSLSKLPPTWLGVGDLDLFLPENLEFAEKLSDAGIKVSIDVYPGAPHAFNLVREARVTQQFYKDFFRALKLGTA